jgi:hypothetical protein
VDYIEITNNKRTYWSTVPDLDLEQYVKLHLLGGYASFTVDMSNTQCGCDTDFTLRVLPAMNADGTINYSKDGLGFCGA